MTVKLRVLKLARQPHYGWTRFSAGRREIDRAYLADAVFDAHSDDPAYNYRLLAYEACQAAEPGCDWAVWRICRDQQWWTHSERMASLLGRPTRGFVLVEWGLLHE